MAAIAGRPEIGDWSIRQVSNESRVRRLAGASEIGAVHDFLARVGLEIDNQDFNDTADTPLTEAWLNQLHHDHRNIVQMSSPAPIVADDAEGALDVVFGRLIIDPVSQTRRFITKHRVLAELRDAYRRADVDTSLVRSRVEVFVGQHIHIPVDFAVANGVAVQLTQGWSFQKAGIDEVSTEVKAWGYALHRLRDGDDARVLADDTRVSQIGRDVDIQVVVAPPLTRQQRDVFEEAEQVFGELNVTVNDLDSVDDVGRRAAALVGNAQG
jgi:hypothetical protein